MTQSNCRRIEFEWRRVAAILALLQVAAQAQRAPFTAVRYVGDAPHVRVGDRWYQLVALDDIEVQVIVKAARDGFGGSWQKRFSEDLDQVLARLGHSAGRTVELELLDARGRTHVIPAAAMTSSNRRLAWRFNNEGGAARSDRPAVRRVVRHRDRDAVDEALTGVSVAEGGAELRRDRIEADLAELEWWLTHQYAFAERRGFDYRHAIDAVVHSLEEWTSVRKFEVLTERLLARFGDPELHRVSPTDATGDEPACRHRRYPDGVGYLRIASLADEGVVIDGIRNAMAALEKTRALVIDVRGLRGASRSAVTALLPYFMADDAGPELVNVAAHRLRPGRAAGDPAGYLSELALYPLQSGLFDDREVELVNAASFVPEWLPPDGKFSQWHYLVARPFRDQGQYHYTGPVVVLVDGGTRGGAEVLIAALRRRDGVTLVGQPSGGADGGPIRVGLRYSGIELELPTMVSFRPDGRMFFGRAVEPDERVEDALARARELLR